MEADIATVFEKLKARRNGEKKNSMPETIGGVKVWSEQERKDYFRRKNADVIPLLDEWNEMDCGAIGKIGPVITLARNAERNAAGKVTIESFARYYEESAKEREKELIILRDGTETERRALVEKYPSVEPINLETTIWKSHGHSYEEIARQAKYMHDVINFGMGTFCKPNQYDLETITNLFVSRVYDAAIVGYEREEKAEQWLKTVLEPKGMKVQQTDYQTDVNDGIDFELYYKGRLCGAVQVKGYNYTNNDVKGEVSSHVRLAKKHECYKRRTGAEIMFCYIEKYRGLMQVRNANEIIRICNKIKERIDAQERSYAPRPHREETVKRSAAEIER